jgi:hypothetical protein
MVTANYRSGAAARRVGGGAVPLGMKTDGPRPERTLAEASIPRGRLPTGTVFTTVKSSPRIIESQFAFCLVVFSIVGYPANFGSKSRLDEEAFSGFLDCVHGH